MEDKIMSNNDDKLSLSARLLKLMNHDEISVDALEQRTGWSRETTQNALLQLVVDGHVKCVRRSGHVLFKLHQFSNQHQSHMVSAC